MAVSTDRRGIDRKRWRATRRTVLARDQYRCRKDELAAGAQGKPVNGPLPKLPGRVLYRAAADRRNTTRLPRGRFAGLQVRLAAPGPRVASRPVNRQHAGQPHDRTPSKAAGYVTSFGPGLVHVSGSVPRPAPAAPPRTNVNTPPATQNVHLFRTASPANVNGIAGPGAFYLPRALFVAADGAGALAV